VLPKLQRWRKLRQIKISSDPTLIVNKKAPTWSELFCFVDQRSTYFFFLAAFFLAAFFAFFAIAF
jgi:hypothetical protein